MKVAVVSLGCKVNKYESDSILQNYFENGYEITDKLEEADVYIINTCAVTNEAEKKSRQMVARCRKYNPDATIYICGCAGQKNPKQFEGKGIQLIKGVAGKQNLYKEKEEKGVKVDELPLSYQKMAFPCQSRTRAYLKVQDGCNNFCTYCIIPYLRGRSRSRSVEDILQEVQNLPEDIKEIVVVGINVSDYKIDGKKGLIDLLEELDKFDKRIRLGSMEDGIIDEDFVSRLSKLKNFCPQFHMSLQSGCDTVLKRMNRHYKAEQFAESVRLIRKYFPKAGVTTDVIVGFPGETDEEFEETRKFIEKVKFSALHIFQYSHREGTVASRMTDVAPEIKKKRAKVLEKLNEKLENEFISQNDVLSVLIEEQENGYWVGHSKNFIKCYIMGQYKVGDIVNVKITKKYLDGVLVEKFN